MSLAVLREYGTALDLPKLALRSVLWGWFLWRTGELLFFWLLRRMRIPHTPKYHYDPKKKLSENMRLRELYQKSKLFQPSQDYLDALAGVQPARRGARLAAPQ